MTRAFLGLGSNLGNRTQFLLEALQRIHRLENTRIVDLSKVFASKPLGNVTDFGFYNMCIAVETGLSALDLLTAIKEIEKEVGRKERPRWAEREIDIDILLFGDEVINEGKLIVPHPGLTSRDFVLIPLLQLDGTLVHPGSGIFLRNFVDQLEQLFIEESLPLQFMILEKDINLIYE